MDRYKILALNRILLILLSIIFSLYLVYYVSPRVEIKRRFMVKINNKRRYQNVKRLYYELNLKSVRPIQIILNSINKGNKPIEMLLLKKRGIPYNYTRMYLSFRESPHPMSVS